MSDIENPFRKLYPNLNKRDIRGQQKAAKEIIHQYKKNNIHPGNYSSDQTKEFSDIIGQNLFDKLKIELKKLNKFSILLYSQKQIEILFAWKEKYNILLNHNKITPEDEIIYQDHSKLINSLSYFIDLIVLFGNEQSKIQIDHKTWSYLYELSIFMEFFTTLSDYLYYVLEIPSTLKNNYELILNHTTKENMDKMVSEYARKNIKLDTYSEQEPLSPELKKEVQNELDILNSAFLKDLEYSYTEYIKFMMYLGTCNGTGFEGIISPKDVKKNKYFPLWEINNEILQFIENDERFNYSQKKIKKMISNLILDIKITKDSPNLIKRSWLLTKSKRFLFCPIIQYGDKLLYGPECFLSTSRLWNAYIFDSNLPFDFSNYPNILKVFKDRQVQADKKFENDVYKIASKILGEKHVWKNIEKYQTLGINERGKLKCGEIDVLAIDSINKKIYVIDAKNYGIRILPKDIKNELSTFFNRKKSDFNHLNAKLDFVKEYKQQILEFISLQNDPNWVMVKVFVTSNLLKSAFLHNLDLEFIYIENFEKFLTCN